MNNNKLQTGGGEKEGQKSFFDDFNIDYENNPILIENTDGVYNSTLFEFKIIIDNLNKVLMQAIKYLSKLRIKGYSVPSNILLVSLSDKTIYYYKSKDYFNEIHKVYYGAASKNNDNFIANDYIAKYNYAIEADVIAVKKILKNTEYLPIDLDENCIVGWGERYYRENPNASKGDFLGDNTGKIKIVGEIRQPKCFKGLINPYKGATNERFKYLMDMLNDRLRKKELGAFYTPIPYCKKAAELIRIAISKIPKGNDYVIIDRCAGTGNLQSVLTDEELSHCILSTYEYYEYKVMCERLGDKVRFIIPPTESLIQYSQGFVINANALSEEYIKNESISAYINDEKCSIILFENPPYQDSSSITFIDEFGERTKTNRNESFVKQEFKKNIGGLKEQRGSAREISNLFIWSAFKYYLRQPTDFYICFSPVKYFKSIGLVKKKFVKGFLFNRKYFHASASAISCILWSNVNSNDNSWKLEAYEIKDNEVVYIKDVTIKEVNKPISDYNDKRKFTDDTESNIVCQSDGREKKGWKNNKKYAIANNNIIGYIAINGYSIDAKHRYLLRLAYWVGVEQSFGYYLRKDNYLLHLPLFCAKLYPQNCWHKKDVYFTSSDKGNEYCLDKNLIKSCLIYVCLCEENKCMTILASNGIMYQNELCLYPSSIAYNDLLTMNLSETERDILSTWDKILKEIKLNCRYKDDIKYGTYQIKEELNTFYENDKGIKVFDYPELNGYLISLKNQLRKYYEQGIEPLLFKYELIK